MNPVHTAFVRRMKGWLWFCLAVLFGVPMMLIVIGLLCGVCNWGGRGYEAIVNAIGFYFHLPASVFGSAHFASSKAIYCPDLVGLILLVGLYLVIAVFFSLVLAALPRLWRKR